MNWESLFNLVLSVLPIIESKKDKDYERATAALEALGRAFYSTSAYYESRFDNESERNATQLNLTKRWDQVAILLRPFDTRLWNRFNLKCRFWYEGVTWSDEQIEDAKIGLEAALFPKSASKS
ncbi:hypothetical protein H9X88_05755 [Aeromonas hydrophila]|uniref:hypothetical protein n=1 Tax=Aeromonas hydrophila TaxID=644 RepID=UPI001B3A20F3|nr:hypothetical protein [Aeromonas hydrophila]MBQ4677710.1 hypothetical protein [Aeromonas hydrophila]MBW3814852.1 hypothetical protein [Aeromonas hydrophila]MCF7677638.1 hypothetical protein [Aeromonas hydrophila]MCF7690441.1 hypothetical protein [Aeromonas hydrophila]MCF7775435.1 hypothetical protein [Aeromonas hydrophila]